MTATGFASYLQNGILLSVGTNVTISVTLPVGSVKQEVQVTANATMVETHDTSVSQVIDSQRVLELPLNGRQATSLVLLSGAAANAASTGDFVSTKTYGSANIAGSTAISIAGGQANGTNFLLDGGDNNHGYSNVSLPVPVSRCHSGIQRADQRTLRALRTPRRRHDERRHQVRHESVSRLAVRVSAQRQRQRAQLLRAGARFAQAQSVRRDGGRARAQGPRSSFFGYQGTRIRTAPPQTLSFVPTAGGQRRRLQPARIRRLPVERKGAHDHESGDRPAVSGRHRPGQPLQSAGAGDSQVCAHGEQSLRHDHVLGAQSGRARISTSGAATG